jgi:hypothetical protein
MLEFKYQASALQVLHVQVRQGQRRRFVALPAALEEGCNGSRCLRVNVGVCCNLVHAALAAGRAPCHHSL